MARAGRGPVVPNILSMETDMMPGRFPLSLLLLAASPAALMLPIPAAMAADAGAAQQQPGHGQ